jgi:hypothetical protein
MQMVQMGVGNAGYYDRDAYIFGYFGVTSGNHTATVVTFEPTGNHGIQRFTGFYTDTRVGLGLGDIDADGMFEAADIEGVGNGSFEDILYSQNMLFDAAADTNGDGVVDNHDLFALGDELVAAGADMATLDAYEDLLLRRGDVDESGMTDTGDVDFLYDSFGATDWLLDLNVDGTVDLVDVSTLLDDILAAHPADFNLDGVVNGLDYLVWAGGFGIDPGGRFTQGDANLDSAVDGLDYLTWASGFGTGAAIHLPEPPAAALFGLGVFLAFATRRAAVR